MPNTTNIDLVKVNDLADTDNGSDMLDVIDANMVKIDTAIGDIAAFLGGY